MPHGYEVFSGLLVAIVILVMIGGAFAAYHRALSPARVLSSGSTRKAERVGVAGLEEGRGLVC